MRDTPTRITLPSEEAVETAIQQALAAPEAPRTVDPSVAARILLPGEQWQVALPLVKRVAQRMAREGRLGIYRKGKPIDTSEFRGVWRFGAPISPADAAQLDIGLADDDEN